MWSTPTASRTMAPRKRAHVAARAVGTLSAASVIVDPLSCRRQRVPLCAELVETLTVGVTGLAVADVEVQRVMGVGDLAPATWAGDHADLPGADAGACTRLRACRESR